MVDKPNYKNHLTPEQYEVCWNKGTEPLFQGSTMAARTKASTSVSAAAAAIAYFLLTPNSILAPTGPVFGAQSMKEV